MQKLPQNYAIMLQNAINIRTICTAYTLKPIKNHKDKESCPTDDIQAVSHTFTAKQQKRRARKQKKVNKDSILWKANK